MKNFSFILFFLLFCSFTLWGQISRQEKKIDVYYEAFNYTKAIAKYEKLANISLEGKRKLAESYRRTYNYAKAQSTYEGWIDTDKASKEDLFAYASLLRMNGDYPKANQYLIRFSSLYPNDLRARDFVANINRFPEFAIDRGFFTINNLSMNSSETDFGTAYFGNKVVFASSRARKKQFAELYNWNQKPYLNLFVSRVLNGQLVDPQQFNKSINKKWHEGTASFYSKGRFMVFTRDNYSKKSGQGEINLQLYFSAFTGTDWSEPLPFKYNNPDYSFGHPSISEDGRVLYFASNMPGGFGGVDIYCSKKDSLGQWSVPVNLGDKINTEDDDMFPFFEEKSQTLFFASRGHLGLGGLDVFRVKKRGNTFGEVKNMGAPINSQGDDFALIIDKSLNGGYFSSNRKEGQGDDDIYSFKVSQPFYQSDFTLNLVVVDENRKQPVANAEVVYNDTAKTITNTDGNVTWHLPFNSETKLAVTAKGLLSQTRKIKVTESDEYEILRDTMQLMQDTVTVKLVDKTTKRFVLRHVYYDFNRWDLLPASFVELDKVAVMLGENPALKAELGSHTDRRGSDKYNLKLSQLRAQSAVDYLVGKGIAKSRIKAVGYGKKRLINPCVDCTEAQHRENRRTEISLPGLVQSVEDTIQFTGESITGEQPSAGSAILSNQVNRSGEINRGEIRYWLYVDSSHDENWSRKLAEKLARQGYNATVVHVDNFYRVGIGCPSLKSMRQIYNVLKFRFRTAWFDYAQ